MPRPGILYAQVIKTVRRRRLVRVSHRIVFGTLEAVNAVLAKRGWQINTSFVERLNLDFRQHVAAVGRRVTRSTRAKTACGNNSCYTTCIITSVCCTPVYVSLCRSLCRRKGQGQPRHGGRVRLQWPLA
jgi:hypothetical protein